MREVMREMLDTKLKHRSMIVTALLVILNTVVLAGVGTSPVLADKPNGNGNGNGKSIGKWAGDLRRRHLGLQFRAEYERARVRLPRSTGSCAHSITCEKRLGLARQTSPARSEKTPPAYAGYSLRR
jgi:hypothetical protein